MIKKNNTEEESNTQNTPTKEKTNEDNNIIENYSLKIKKESNNIDENNLHQNKNIELNQYDDNREEKNEDKYFSKECTFLFENIRYKIDSSNGYSHENMKKIFTDLNKDAILANCGKDGLENLKNFENILDSEIKESITNKNYKNSTILDKLFFTSLIDHSIKSIYRRNFNMNDISSITDPYKIALIIESYLNGRNQKNIKNYDDILQKLLLRLIEIKGYSQDALYLLISAENMRFYYKNKEKTCNMNDILNYKPLIEPFEPNVFFEPLTSFTQSMIEHPGANIIFYHYFQEYLKSPCDPDVLDSFFQNIKKPILYDKNEDYKKDYLKRELSLKEYFKGLASVCQYKKNKAPLPRNLEPDEEMPMSLYIYQQYREGNISLDGISKNSFFPLAFCKYEK